jgi:hypothetical protein
MNTRANSVEVRLSAGYVLPEPDSSGSPWWRLPLRRLPRSARFSLTKT